MYYATAEEMEKLDKLAVEQGLKIGQMMELAGWHMVSLFQELNIPKDAGVLMVAGKGNKGGDSLSAARHLVNHGWRVRVLLVDMEISSDSAHHLKLLQKMHVPLQNFSDAKEYMAQSDVIIDGLIGYHLDGAPRGVFKEAIEMINASKKKIIAYDLPSGADPNTGECAGSCIQAFATLSLAMPKKLFDTQQGKKKSGKVFVADIGIPSFLYDQIALHARPVFDKSIGLLIL